MKDKLIKKFNQLLQRYTDYVALQQISTDTTAVIADQTSSQVPLEKILELAQELLKIRSVTENVTETQKAIALVGKQLTDFTIETFKADGRQSLLVHNAAQGTKNFKVIFNAHLDVVNGKDSQFNPHITDGKLYGRGALDMKAAAAVMVYVFKDIARTLHYPFALQFVADEEIATGQGTLTQLSRGIRSDITIIGECGSSMDILNETKGLIHAELHTSGSTAHGAYPWRGENAIIKMQKALLLLHELYPIPESETFETTMNVSRISTNNETWNKIPDQCTATLDIRFNRKQNIKEILARVNKILPNDIVLEVHKTRNANYTDPENKYIQALRKAGTSILGRDLVVRGTFGGSDSVFFADAGLNAIDFGPVGHGQHHDDEWVDIKSLEDYYMILKRFLLAIDEK